MIVLLTPTGAREAQFKLCLLWMSRQTYGGEVTWIIIDDAIPKTTDEVKDNFKANWHIVKLYPNPPWQYGQNTQSRNMTAGLAYARTLPNVEAIFIIEDDDYYRPTYLERMMARIGTFKVLGEANTVYYNVVYRTYFVHNNTSYSSLFQIVFVPEMIPLFESCFNERFIDLKFFEKLRKQEFVKRREVGLFNENNLAIGIKGMPGRFGIGEGHTFLNNMLPDPNLVYLNQIIGDDAKHYAGYYGNIHCTQYPNSFRKRF